MHIMYPLAHKKQAMYRILEKKVQHHKIAAWANIMMVVVSRLIGKKVENYLFKVGETRQTSTRHVQNIRWSGFFFAQNWFYNYMRKKTCYILILSKQNSANNSQFKIYPSKNCSSFNQSQHDSKNLTNAVKEEQKIYWLGCVTFS